MEKFFVGCWEEIFGGTENLNQKIFKILES